MEVKQMPYTIELLQRRWYLIKRYFWISSNQLDEVRIYNVHMSTDVEYQKNSVDR